MGVPEFWRYNGRDWRIFALQENGYQERDRSPLFPGVEKADLYQFLEQAQQDEIAAETTLRQLMQQKLRQQNE